MKEHRKPRQDKKKDVPAAGHILPTQDANKPLADNKSGYFEKKNINKDPHGGCGCS